ncbi:hypothetical protein AVEN_37727-1 [Araneus ventricosus]|uniref:Uncharacterized protein n=1 Tax=Araneus ventricosus TaxID=182803 RepID=A0A4Y2BST3_ARAVE|nr:hypothetical protein AVEN_37727-1 [Araneus ventricosus]
MTVALSLIVTELNGFLKQIPGCGNCEEDDLSSWLDCEADDAGFQLMSDDEIIAQVRKPNTDGDKHDEDEVMKLRESKLLKYATPMIWNVLLMD